MKERISFVELSGFSACPLGRDWFYSRFGASATIKEVVQALHADRNDERLALDIRKELEAWEAWGLSQTFEIAEAAIAAGAKANVNGSSALSAAEYSGSTKLFDLLLANGADIHVINGEIELACLLNFRHYAMVEHIAKRGVPIDFGDNETLHTMIRRDDERSIKFLLEHGADAKEGLRLAREQQNADLIKLFEDAIGSSKAR